MIQLLQCDHQMHTLNYHFNFNTQTPTCFGPHWPIIGECTVV